MLFLRKRITEMPVERISKEHILERKSEIVENAKNILKNEELARKIIELGVSDDGFLHEGISELVKRDAIKGGKIIRKLDERKLKAIAKAIHTSYLQRLDDDVKAKISKMLIKEGDTIKAVDLIKTLSNPYLKANLMEKIVDSSHVKKRRLLEKLLNDPDAMIIVFRKERHADFEPELMEIVENAFKRYPPQKKRQVIAHLLEFDMKNDEAIRRSIGILLEYMRGTGTDPENLQVLEHLLEKLEQIAVERKQEIGKELLARGGPEAMKATLTLIKAKKNHKEVKKWAEKSIAIFEEALENVDPETLKQYGIDPRTYYTSLFQIATNVLGNEKVHDLSWIDKEMVHKHIHEAIEHIGRKSELLDHVMDQTVKRFAEAMISGLENGHMYLQRLLFHLARQKPEIGRIIANVYLSNHPQPKTRVNELHAAFYSYFRAENPDINHEEAVKRAGDLIHRVVKHPRPRGLLHG